jgi:GNAT superfamily N-acetyltransferase
LKIITASEEHLDALAGVLADSFVDDPLMTWVFPDQRRERLAIMFRYLAAGSYVRSGASTVMFDGNEMVGAALWLPPTHDEVAEEAYRAEYGPAFAEAMGDGIVRLAELGEIMEAHEPVEPHWYLLAVGINPDRQGRGLGRALIEHRLEEIERHVDTQTGRETVSDLGPGAGTDVYLEATSPRSRVLYRRLGFADIGELQMNDGPTVWAMWRAGSAPTDDRAAASGRL